MAFAVSAAFVAGTLAVSTGYEIYSGERANRLQEKANDDARTQARITAEQADQAFNKANGKRPNMASIFGANAAAAKGGLSGTMLTGPQGIDSGNLLLGKTTLLGG